VLSNGPSAHLTWQHVPRAVGVCHFRSHDKDGGHTIRSATAKNSMLHANFVAIFYRTGVIADKKFYTAGIGFLAPMALMLIQ